MNKKEYEKGLEEIFKDTIRKIAKLQSKLTREQIIEFRGEFDTMILFFLYGAVGEEAILHYLIDLLSTASKMEWSRNQMNEEQLKRYKKIRMENELDER